MHLIRPVDQLKDSRILCRNTHRYIIHICIYMTTRFFYINPLQVETIGDAYMVVSSVPEPTEDHADRLVMLGLEMVAVSRKIQSPVPGHKLEVSTLSVRTLSWYPLIRPCRKAGIWRLSLTRVLKE